jgi:hypothetical protein
LKHYIFLLDLFVTEAKRGYPGHLGVREIWARLDDKFSLREADGMTQFEYVVLAANTASPLYIVTYVRFVFVFRVSLLAIFTNVLCNKCKQSKYVVPVIPPDSAYAPSFARSGFTEDRLPSSEYP